MASPISYVPHPRDYRRIREDTALGVPYVVPAGKVFVLTGLGTNGLEFEDESVAQEQPCIPAKLTSLFFPGMPDYDTSGAGGDDVRGGVIGDNVTAVLTGTRLRRNFCSVAKAPPCCVYRAGTQIEVFGGNSPAGFLNIDARAYGYEAPAS